MICIDVAASEMTYTVSGGALNSAQPFDWIPYDDSSPSNSVIYYISFLTLAPHCCMYVC